MTTLQLLPEDRKASVIRALQATYAVAQPEELTLMAGGYSSSKTYQIRVKNHQAVLRVMGLDQALPDREKQITCFRLAAAKNLAPACYYANAADGIILMEHIQHLGYEATRSWLADMACTLQKLHHIETFPVHHLHSVFVYMDGLIANVKQYPLSGLLTQFLEKIANIKSALAPNLTRVSCHNDLNPNNVLFDGKKIYLIDWEAAGADDPFFDLATVCNQFIFEPSLQNDFLQQYFGRTPTAEELEKLQLMRHIAYAYTAFHFFEFAANAGLSLTDQNIDAIPDALAWKTGYTTGAYSLTKPTDFLLYGMMQVKMSFNLLD